MEWVGVIFRLIILMGAGIAIITALEVAVFIADCKREDKENENKADSESE